MAVAYTQISKNKFRTWLLMAGFMGVVMLMGLIFGEYLAPGGGVLGVIVAAGIALVWGLVAYYSATKITLSANHARPIEKHEHPQLYNLVENLSITAGLPMPQVYIMESDALNAFATGRDPEHAIVAVTTGLLNTLDKNELEGVLAHELSHIGNYDIRLMLIVTALAGVVMILTEFFWRVSVNGGGRRRGGGKSQAVLLIVGVFLMVLAPLFASLIKMSISRKREFLADASGALLTRYPEGLASALEKIAQSATPMRSANKGTAHLFISNPFKKGTWSKWFSTHPPIEERIKILRGMDGLT